MKRNNILKILSVLLAFLLTINIVFSNPYIICANEELTDDEKKVVLEQKLKQVNTRLNYLAKNSTQTQEYLDTLQNKLEYLKQQYQLIDNDSQKIQNAVKVIQADIKNNKQEITDSKKELVLLQTEQENLNSEFKKVYDKYCQRLRAMYVSQSDNTYLMFLLDSDSVENFLIRLQMFMSVTKSDSELLNNVNSQMDSIISTRNDIESNKTKLETNKQKLESNQVELKSQRAILFSQKDKLENQKLIIEKEQQDANKILKALNDKTQKYGEYRDITKEELAQIDKSIAFGDEKYPEKEQNANDNQNEESQTTNNRKDDFLNLTFPCPDYTEITCGFGEYKGHSGCDFSTRQNENEKIVAAESGTVILVKLLNKSYGHYLVIRHDKKTENGEVAYTLYAHNNDIIVNEGDYVAKGQQIAYSGTTGNSTGPHCHFEVRVGGSSQAYAKDPKIYLPKGSS